MGLTNCARCKQLFQSAGGGVICPDCLEQDEKDFEVVNHALRENPNQAIPELAEATGVSERRILRFLEEGRILSDAVAHDVKCGKCGQPAISATLRLCESCSADLARESAQAAAEIKKLQGKQAVSTHDLLEKKLGKNRPGS